MLIVKTIFIGKKARWSVMNNGSIVKYKSKGDKHPFGGKITLAGPGGLVQSQNELDLIRSAHTKDNRVVYPFYLCIQKKRQRKICSFRC